jgi:hypothetical protein
MFGTGLEWLRELPVMLLDAHELGQVRMSTAHVHELEQAAESKSKPRCRP